MARWDVWLRCIGQAVVQKGLKALAGMIPFGDAIYAIGAAACDLVKKEEQREEDRRILLQELIQASDQQIHQAAEEAAQQAAAGLSAEVRERLTIYLMQVPAVARQSLRRPDDPTGTTVPPARALSRPEDVLPLLPTRTPRFKVGDRPLPGVDWELEQLLGVGGFGEVWKARNPHFDGVPPAALKFCLDPNAKERLLGHEAAVLNQVMRHGRHPGIVALKHTYLSADPPCLEYEYVAGGDLGTLIQQWHQRRPADLIQRVLAAMTGLTKVIAFAHQLNPPIVHRDLKPANILLQPLANGTHVLRVADFGIGGVAAQQALEQTKSGTTPHDYILNSLMLGSYTPLYASPQQMRRAPPDPRDDVHALGVIWLQMLTGNLTQGAVADWREELTELKVPEAVLQVLAKCLATKPEKRLGSAGALVEAIDFLRQATSATPRHGDITVYPTGVVLEFPSPSHLTDALARGVPALRLAARFAILPNEKDIDYRHLRLTGTLDYTTLPEKCVDVNEDGVTLSIDLARSDLLLETELVRFAEPVALSPGRPWGQKLYRMTSASMAAAREGGLRDSDLERWFEFRTGGPVPAMARLLLTGPDPVRAE